MDVVAVSLSEMLTGEMCALSCRGLALIDYLEDFAPVSRMADGPVRMPVVDRYRVGAYGEREWLVSYSIRSVNATLIFI